MEKSASDTREAEEMHKGAEHDRDETLLRTAAAARYVTRHIREGFYGCNASRLTTVKPDNRGGCGWTDPPANSQRIQEVCRSFGADMAAVCPNDARWLHPAARAAGLDTLPWVIVMVVAMDARRIRTSPSAAVSSTTHLGYLRMAQTASLVATFLKMEGFSATASGNGEAPSIPFAVSCGLGILGRNGMLVTRRYGSCIRICKVFTDLPCTPDPPRVDEELIGYCAACTRCADACPAGAITALPGEGTGGYRPDSQTWKIDTSACTARFRSGRGTCANCIAACPFTPEE